MIVRGHLSSEAYRGDSKGDQAVEGDGASCQSGKGGATLVSQDAGHQADLQESGHHIEHLQAHLWSAFPQAACTLNAAGGKLFTVSSTDLC